MHLGAIKVRVRQGPAPWGNQGNFQDKVHPARRARIRSGEVASSRPKKCQKQVDLDSGHPFRCLNW